MLKEQQRLDDAYRATMLYSRSQSDFAIQTAAVVQGQQRRFKSFPAGSLVVSLYRKDIDKALEELNALFHEASEHNWDGPGSQAMHPLTYDLAMEFIRALPWGVDAPALNVDPDGEVTFDWNYGRDRMLAVSLSLSGRLSFIYRNRQVRMRDTLWFVDGQVPNELLDLYRNLKR